MVSLDGVGSEQRNTRPAIIVQNDVGNAHSPTTVIVPLSTKIKPSMATTHVKITSKQGVRDESEALCEQLRVVDKSRFGRRVGKITDESVMTDITRKIKVVCGC